ncbi:MAG: hypothetical protein ABSG78_11815 [Verrucomicrobiota bacterium]
MNLFFDAPELLLARQPEIIFALQVQPKPGDINSMMPFLAG